ncbi:hypothetical protein BH11ACT8_BH11ACT8_31640 [soil metagenome]
MKPLQSIAMGFVILALFARVGDYDLLADPLGWLLVIAGVRRLPASYERRTTLVWVAGLALVVSVPLWFPGVVDALGREDASLAWTADLPGFAFVALLFHELAAVAATARDRWAERICAVLVTATGVVAALPVLVFGAGYDSWSDPAAAAAELLRVATIIALFGYAGRAWAEPANPDSAADPVDSS